MRSIDRVKPYDKNPRKNDAAVEAVARSIKDHGFRQPIVVDANGVIIVGHTRYKAALKLGLAKVPVHVADLSPEKARAYRIADNATNDLATWDESLLAGELAGLRESGVNIAGLGIVDSEISRLLQPGTDVQDPDFVPEPPDEPKTKPGDIWVLGNHRLMCGDSSSPDDLDALLAGAKIHLVNTDPPYNVKVEPRSNNAIAAGNSSFTMAQRKDGSAGDQQAADLQRYPEKNKATHKKMRAKDRPLANDFVSDQEFDRLLAAWFGNISRVLVPGGSFYCWGGYANVANYPPAFKAAGLYFSQAIIWVKEHPVLTRKDFMGNHEWCQPAGTMVLTPDGPRAIEAVQDGDRVIGFRRSDSRLYPRGLPVSRTSRHYDGEMLTVAVNARSTRCTPNHIWSIRLAPDSVEKWVVYLMRRGDWWRVGKSKATSSWGFGVKQRLHTEGGDAAWILSVHDSNVDATAREQFVQSQYGIPTTTWAESHQSRRTLADVAALYGMIDLGKLRAGAMAALKDHGRDADFPLLVPANLREKVSWRVSTQVRACNLVPGLMAVPVPDGESSSVPWFPVESVTRQPFSGRVYSMEVPHGHYVADGIVTHNCFYGWREGAGHNFYGPNNVPDVWSIKKVNPQSMVHLTEKPVELAKRAIEYSSKHGQNVLDLFGGSGSTMMACELTGRNGYSMELDPAYCDVIVERWEKASGKKAVLQRKPVVNGPTPRSPSKSAA